MMKFIDLKTQYHQSKEQIDRAIQKVLDHGQYILGPEVTEMEQRLAKWAGVKHCIAVGSGTQALIVAMMGLEIQPGDEVITSPFSFFATTEMIVMLGAKPVYVDIDPATYNMDPTHIEAAITDRTKLIMPVSLYGQCPDMDAINAIADKHGLPVIEDAAQSMGGFYKGRASCGLSTIACASFFPSKPLGCYGDGGACFTNDDQLAERMRSVANHGQQGRYNHVIMGINGRFDTIQAAVILAKLDHFEDELAQRQVVAGWYAKALANKVRIPQIAEYNKSAWAQYTIEVEERDAFQAAMKEAGIPTAVHYPCLLPDQPAVKGKTSTGHFPHAAHAANSVVSLPFHPYMQESDVEQVARAVCDVLVPA